jgi:hypothetical protein
VRNEAALVVLAAAFLVAMMQLLERPAAQRLPIRPSSRRRVDEREPEARVGTGLAGRLVGGGMVAATVGLIGQLAAPAAEPLWLALIAAAFASLPAALAAPLIESLWKGRRRESQEESS